MDLKTRLTKKYGSFFLRFRLPFKKTFSASILLYNSPDTWTRGYSARTENGQYVLFLDYDNLDLSAVVGELKYLQKRFSLSDCFVFRTDRENSFHAVCLDTFPLVEAYSILKETSCDFAFINSIKRLKTKEWVLRLTGKGGRGAPNFLLRLPGKGKRVKSSAHAEFLRSLEIDVPKKGRWDKCGRLTIIDYTTANRVEGERFI